MGENSGIQWTTHTFNPWEGCQRVSPGCQHCYAEARNHRFAGDDESKVLWGPNAPRRRTSAANWRKPIAWDKAAKAAGERHRVFCASLADVFEDREELIPWRRELFELIDATPNLDWLLLSKRPENIMAMLPWGWLSGFEQGLVAPNVWFGTTVEDQQRADARIPALLSVPAKVRFLSCEPLLERVDLTAHLWLNSLGRSNIDWIIIGGESGHGARPFGIDWARSLVNQCRALGAATFVKQLGANPCRGQVEYDREGSLHLPLKDSHGGDWDEWPADLRIREFPR